MSTTSAPVNLRGETEINEDEYWALKREIVNRLAASKTGERMVFTGLPDYNGQRRSAVVTNVTQPRFPSQFAGDPGDQLDLDAMASWLAGDYFRRCPV